MWAANTLTLLLAAGSGRSGSRARVSPIPTTRSFRASSARASGCKALEVLGLVGMHAHGAPDVRLRAGNGLHRREVGPAGRRWSASAPRPPGGRARSPRLAILGEGGGVQVDVAVDRACRRSLPSARSARSSARAGSRTRRRDQGSAPPTSPGQRGRTPPEPRPRPPPRPPSPRSSAASRSRSPRPFEQQGEAVGPLPAPEPIGELDQGVGVVAGRLSPPPAARPPRRPAPGRRRRRATAPGRAQPFAMRASRTASASSTCSRSAANAASAASGQGANASRRQRERMVVEQPSGRMADQQQHAPRRTAPPASSAPRWRRWRSGRRRRR